MSYDRQRRYERRKAAEVADVGEIPAVVNPQRRESCRRDLLRFLQTYFPHTTGLKPFSQDHKDVIAVLQQCVFDGGSFAQAVYRGFAKTTISENAAIWAVLYGHRKFVPIFGADGSAADGNIDSIKIELSENELLYQDFPETCHAVAALENKPQRCASQTHSTWSPCEECGASGKVIKESSAGQPREVNCPDCGGLGKVGDPQLTHIEWRGDTIVLPTVRVLEGFDAVGGPAAGAKLISSPASGGIIKARGIMAGCRGMKHKQADGTQQRPDFAIIDDPQTDESASTELQVKKRVNVIKKGILKLAGHNRRMAVVMNATVIKPDDLVEQFLDPKKNPAWQGKRIKMVSRWADAHETLWLGEYQAIRNDYDPDVLNDQLRAHKAATAFYVAHRSEMDAGCCVSWEHCFDPERELSAIQHAYNELIDHGEEVFASECQNEPLRQEQDAGVAMLKAAEIAAKLSGLDRGDLPQSASHLTIFIDPKEKILYWVACAFDDEFDGFVVDYDTYPKQSKPYFAARDAKPTLAKTTAVSGVEPQVYRGLENLVNELMARDWRRSDGTLLKPERILIDAHYGKLTDVVTKFCRHSRHAAVLTPSHGKYYGASTVPMREHKRKQGERVGLNWRMPPGGKREVRHVVYDTNFWKSFFHARLATPMGGRGCMSLFGSDPKKDPKKHELFVDHLLAEPAAEVSSKGRTVIEFKEKPNKPDNDYFDSVVGCCVAASMQGVSLKEMKGDAVTRIRVRLSDLQKARRGGSTAPAASPVSASSAESTAPEQPAQQPKRRIRLSDLQKEKRKNG